MFLLLILDNTYGHLYAFMLFIRCLVLTSFIMIFLVILCACEAIILTNLALTGQKHYKPQQLFWWIIPLSPLPPS